MSRTLEQIIAALTALEAKDFDYSLPAANGLEQLQSLTHELRALPQPERAVRALFDVMERMPTADLGSPGALVHTLEEMTGHYELELAESIKRVPTPLSLWMVNRILNSECAPEQRKLWMDLLMSAAVDPKAAEVSRSEAQFFIRHQNKGA